MIEVKIPKEIRAYKSAFLFGLTLRQSIWTGIALFININLYLLLKAHIGSDAAGWIILVTAAPPLLMGFATYNKMPFEKFAVCVLRFLFTPQKRKYETDNFYKTIMEGDGSREATEKKERKKFGKGK